MKAIYLYVGVVVCMLISCNTPGGNKSILPVQDGDTVSSESVEQRAHTKENTSDFNYKLIFTAFKTPKKTGVEGTFTDIQLSGTTDTDSLTTSLAGSTFVVNTSTVSTDDPARDEKIRNFFFNKLTDPTQITGNFGTFKNNSVPVTLKMNGVEKTIPMTYQLKSNELTLNGSIDIIKDFSGSAALESINQACLDLHEKKTWSDVTLKVIISK